MIDILLLGATGYTGRLIARYLASHPQRSAFTFGLAARSESKLRTLVHEYSPSFTDVPIFVVDVENSTEIDQVVQQARVVINAVGPYSRWGTPVVRACVRHGRHYVDLTGEAPWVKDMIFEFDYVATKAGSVIVPCAALDSIPSDILVYFANKVLKEFAGPSTNIDISTSAWDIRGAGISGGTFSSILLHLEDIALEKVEAASKDFALSPIRGTPSPRPRVFYSLPISKPPVQGALYLMSIINLQVVQRSWGLFELARRSPRVAFGPACSQDGEQQNISQQSYGPDFKYEEFLALPSRLHSFLVVLFLATVAFALKVFPFARYLARKLMPQPGEGPTEQQLQEGSVNITNVTTSRPDSEGRTINVRTTFLGKGDGYLLSSVMISESAIALVLDRASLPPFAKRGGVLTPMTAFGDVLIERLKACGRISIESEVLVADSQGRKRR
ncbi:Saccharopine dehydrogenase-domain-containing protein [Phlebopus sp. FC_14]|nr:Saccharopine dehydrogenase-domain-containing protein [Phlebopus sp. FC_14]